MFDPDRQYHWGGVSVGFSKISLHRAGFAQDPTGFLRPFLSQLVASHHHATHACWGFSLGIPVRLLVTNGCK